MTKILRCTCANNFQDKTYGSKMRVHNMMKNKSYRCTVCLNTKSVAYEAPVQSEKK